MGSVISLASMSFASTVIIEWKDGRCLLIAAFGIVLGHFCDADCSAAVLGGSVYWPDWRDGILLLILSSFAQLFVSANICAIC